MQRGYVGVCNLLVRKLLVGVVLLAGFIVSWGGLGKIYPNLFLPDEENGHFFINVLLPPAASLERTGAVMCEIDRIIGSEPGIQYYNAVAGYSLLSQTVSSRNGLYFCQLKPYEERKNVGFRADAIVADVNRNWRLYPTRKRLDFCLR